MEYRFASNRKVSFIVSADGQNWLVQFDDPNQSGVCGFMTSNPKIAHAVRRHAMSRRGVIKEIGATSLDSEGTAAEMPDGETSGVVVPDGETSGVVEGSGNESTVTEPGNETTAEQAEAEPEAETSLESEGTTAEGTAAENAEEATTAEEREYDNYTVAREEICKEFGVNKSTVRNPDALAQLAKEHGITITYKEL